MEGKLELGRQRRFLSHVQDCEDCMYELETGFLVYSGIKKIDAGESFDFEKDFEKKMSDCRSFVKLATRAKAGLVILIIIATVSLLCFWTGVFTL